MRRLLTAATALAVAAVGALAGPAHGGSGGGRSSHAALPVVAPYVDMGEHSFGLLDRALRHDHLRSFTAGFVIGHGCQPVWDDTDPITAAPAPTEALAKARSLGAKVIVSFGGEGGLDLARSCSDPAKLRAAYRTVVADLKPAALDFDIEGASIEDPVSIARRFEAIHSLEARYPDIRVSLTIPVEPGGLDPSGRALLRSAAAEHVRVDLVNLMAMDYGGGSRNMGSAAISAVRGALRQVKRVWPSDTYADLGITPMIGVNDNAHERFTVSDAHRVATFASVHHVGRLAFWAIERDKRCPAKAHRARSTCSSIDQSTLAFTRAFL